MRIVKTTPEREARLLAFESLFREVCKNPESPKEALRLFKAYQSDVAPPELASSAFRFYHAWMVYQSACNKYSRQIP